MKSQSVENLKATFQLEVFYIPCVSSHSEMQEFALQIFAAWLARVAVRRTSIEPNTSQSSANSEQNALTSEPVGCTVGTQSPCIPGDSNK